MHAAEGFETVHAGEPDVEKNDFEIAASDAFERFFRGLGGFDVIALVAEDRRERFSNAGFVVNDKNVRVRRHEKSCRIQVIAFAVVWQRRDKAWRNRGWKKRGDTPSPFLHKC